MEPVQTCYLVLLSDLYLFALGMITTMIIVILYAAITGLCQPGKHERRLMQIQHEKERAQRELTNITQDYLHQLRK